MKPSELAALLGVDVKTVRRYIAKGLLPAKKGGLGFEISPLDAQILRRKADARKKLNGRIKELFVLREFDTPFSHIQEEYSLSPDDVDHAVYLYRFERGIYLSKFGIRYTSDFLLVEEVSARLKVTDRHIPYHLHELGELEMHTLKWRGKERFFPSKRSFGDYLGPAVQTILYNSREAAFQTGLTVELIDRLALDNDIGRKIKNGNKNSNYLFTPEDIDKLRFNRERKIKI